MSKYFENEQQSINTLAVCEQFVLLTKVNDQSKANYGAFYTHGYSPVHVCVCDLDWLSGD